MLKFKISEKCFEPHEKLKIAVQIQGDNKEIRLNTVVATFTQINNE